MVMSRKMNWPSLNTLNFSMANCRRRYTDEIAVEERLALYFVRQRYRFNQAKWQYGCVMQKIKIPIFQSLKSCSHVFFRVRWSPGTGFSFNNSCFRLFALTVRTCLRPPQAQEGNLRWIIDPGLVLIINFYFYFHYRKQNLKCCFLPQANPDRCR